MKIRILLPFLLILLFSSIAFSQSDSRSITSDDFNSQRPAARQNTRNPLQKPTVRRANYKFVRREQTPVRRKTTVRNRPQPNTKPEKVTEIGVTMWKLRPSRSSDAGYKLPVLINNQRQMWTAERVSLDHIFGAGDRIRLAIESSVTGYLYVVNSEIYKDGSFGDAYLIFPASSGEDNSVRPGLLVDIPDQAEDLPYFLIKPKNADYKGELLTIIISPKPLTNLRTDADGKIKNLDDLIDLETDSDAEIFSRTDTQDKIYAESEAQAACGSKTRQLTREKTNENPCGEKTRDLTRAEPLPQTIFRIKTRAGQPSVAFVILNVKQ